MTFAPDSRELGYPRCVRPAVCSRAAQPLRPADRKHRINTEPLGRIKPDKRRRRAYNRVPERHAHTLRTPRARSQRETPAVVMKLFAILIRLIVSVAKLSVAHPLSSSSPPIMNTFVPCLCLASSASASEFVTTLTDSPSGSPRTICKPTGDAGRKNHLIRLYKRNRVSRD